MRYLKWIFPLTLLYIALTANVAPANWLLGSLVAGGITFLLRPEPAPLRWRALPGALLAAVQFLLTLFWDLLLSSLLLSRRLLQRDMQLRQGIVALPAGEDHPAVTLLSAHAITLTPGEMVVEIDDDGVLYVHSLDATATAAQGPAAQRRRARQLQRIFRQ